MDKNELTLRLALIFMVLMIVGVCGFGLRDQQTNECVVAVASGKLPASDAAAVAKLCR